MPTRRYPRPESVKAIGWILLINAVFAAGVLVDASVEKTPARDDAMFLTYGVALAVASVICGLFLLRGANWARIVFFAAWLPLYLLFLTCQESPHAVLRAIIPFLLSPFLGSRLANRFFMGRDTVFKPKKADPQQVQRESKERSDRRSGRYDY